MSDILKLKVAQILQIQKGFMYSATKKVNS